MKFFKKFFAVILSFHILIFGLYPGLPDAVFAAAGQSAVVTGHWAADVVNKWISKGLIKDYGGIKGRLDYPVTRAEMVALLDSVFNFTDKNYVAFSDVPAGSKYADAIYKAVTAGIIKGYDDGTFRPDAFISRQETAVLLYKAFDLKVKDKNAAEKYSDYDSLTSWSRDAVSALSENGYVTEKAGNRFAPSESITLAEAVTLIDRIAGQIINTSGTFSGNVNGNLLLNVPSITLQNVSVVGNLFLAQGIGTGHVTLNNLKITGNLVIRGGGENSIYLNNTTVQGILVIDKRDGKVRVVAKGTSDVPNVQVNSGASIGEDGVTGRGFGDVDIPKETPAGSQINLDGSFGAVSAAAAGVTIQVQRDASVSRLELKTGAKDSSVLMYGKSIGELNLRAKSNVRLFAGTVGKLEIQENAAASDVNVEGAAVTALAVKAKSSVDILSGSVATLDIDEKSAGSSVSLAGGASVGTLNANGDVNVTGQGSIGTANVNAENVAIERQPATVAVAPGVSAVIGGKVSTWSDTSSTTAASSELTATLTPPTAGQYTTQLVVTFSKALSASTLAITDRSELLESITYDSTALSVSSRKGTVVWSGTVDNPVATITTTSTKYEADHTVGMSFIDGVVMDLSGNPLSTTGISAEIRENPTGILALNPTSGTAGATGQTITLTYTPSEYLENGSVTFTLPAGFAPSAADDTFSVAGGEAQDLSSSQVEISGQKVTIKDLTISENQSVVLTLNNKTIPAAGSYTFRAVCDPDGTGTARLPSGGTGTEAKTFTSGAASSTEAGTLEVSPTGAPTGTKKSIVLTYTVGETMENGMVVFTLPTGFAAAVAADTVSVSGGTASGLMSGQVADGGHTVTIYDLNMSAGQQVVLSLNNKTMPPAGVYNFSAKADADGTKGAQTASPGTGTEVFSFISSSSNATTAGYLAISPSSASSGVTQDITLTYTPGETLTLGTVVFALPSEIPATVSDSVSVAGGNAEALVPGQISSGGRTVTITGVTATPSQSVVLLLKGKTMPAAGSYRFSGAADTDGSGPRTMSPGTGNETVTFLSNAATSTNPGTLEISPANAYVGTTQDITLTYRPGQALANGTVTFTLPAGFPPVQATDTVTVPGGTETNLTSQQVKGQVVEITGVNADTLQQVVLKLKGKTVPAAGSYGFSATADADGPATVKLPSPGTGTEAAAFTSNSYNAPLLTADPSAKVDDTGIDITFADDGAWWKAVTGVTVDGSALPANAYSISVDSGTGTISLHPSQSPLLQRPGNKTVAVSATNYGTAVISQVINPGNAASLAIDTQPVAPVVNGGLLAVQPVVKIVDIYGNTCTNITNTAVTAAKGDAGAWTLEGPLTADTNSGIAAFSGLMARSSAQVLGAKLSFSYPGLTPVDSNIFTIPSPAVPVLTADATASVDDPSIDITFSEPDENSVGYAWRTKITSIKVDGVQLQPGDYDISSAGAVKLIPSSAAPQALRTAGNKVVTIDADTFPQVTVNQTIKHGAAKNIVISVAPVPPAQDSTAFYVQPVVRLQDRYGNNCTGDSSTQVTVSNGGSAEWTLGGTTTVTAASGVVAYTDLTAAREGQVTGAVLVFTGTGLAQAQSAPFTLPAPMGDDTAVVVSTSPAVNEYGYMNGDLASITGTATNNHNNLSAVKVRIKKEDPQNGFKYLSSVTSGAFNSTSPVSFTVSSFSGTENSWSLPVTGVVFGDGKYTVETLANDGVDGSTVNYYTWIVDKTAPSAITASSSTPNVLSGNNGGGLVLTVVDGPLTNQSWYGILDQIKANTGTGGNWITGISPGSLYLDIASDGKSAELKNSSSVDAAIAADFLISKSNVVDFAGNTAENDIPVHAYKSAPAITGAVCAEGGAAEAGLGAGDTLTLTFDVATNQTTGVNLSKSAVDSLLTFSRPFGANYTGKWTNSKTLVITSVDASGASFSLGDTVTVNETANVRTSDGLSWSSTSTSPACTGTLDPVPSIVSAVCAEGGTLEAGFGAGDTLTLTFDIPTNQVANTTYADKGEVDAVLTFSAPFGTDYSGKWTDRQHLVITSVDPASAGFTIGQDFVTVKASANIKSQNGTTAASSSTSPLSTGTFDPVPVITAAVCAEGGPSEVGFGTGDTLTLTFSLPTNKTAGTSYGNKAAVDQILAFSTSLGTDYTGVWTDNQTLVITSVNASGATFALGDKVTVKPEANIRTADGSSPASTSTSPASTGNLDPIPFITGVVCAEGGTVEAGFGAGDTITIIFSIPTNKAAGTTYGDKAAVDSILTFSSSFGADYSGSWSDSQHLVITSQDPSGAAFAVGGTVTVLSAADIRSASGTSQPSTSTSPASTGSFNYIDLSDAVLTAPAAPAAGVPFNIGISGAKGTGGTALSGPVNVTVTSSNTSEGTGGVVYNTACNFTAGAAAVPVTLNTTGPQVLTVQITGVTASKTVNVNVQSSDNDITAFTLAAQTGPAVIDPVNHTVSIQVAYGTSLTSLAPTISVSSGATITPASGVARNFTSPVTYTVKSAGGTSQTWTVAVTVAPSSAKDITSFSIPGQVGTAAINTTAHTVAVQMPATTDLSSLTPTIGVSAGASVDPASGVAQDFTSPVTYRVTAADLSTQDWTVTVTTLPIITVAGSAAADSTVTMVAPANTAVSSSDKTWTIDITSGTVKSGVSISDLDISGLPSGLGATAAKAPGTGVNKIVITVSGTAVPAITGKTFINIIVKGSAVTEAGAQNSAAIPVTIEAGSFQITGTAGTNNTVKMKGPDQKDVDPAYKTWTINVTTGTVNTSNITATPVELTGASDEPLTVIGLPSGLKASFSKGAGNTIDLLVSGTADNALTAAVTVSVVLKDKAVAEAGATPSNAIALTLAPGSFQIAGSAADDVVEMKSPAYTVPDTSNDTWELSVDNGKVKEGLTVNDLTITGLPSGLTAYAVKGTGDTILVTVGGAASSAVTAAAAVNIVIKASAVLNAGAVNSAPIAVRVVPAPFALTAGAEDDTVVMTAPALTAVSPEDKTWTLSTDGTVKSGVTINDLTVAGLPQGLTLTAAKGTGNTIVVTVGGTAALPVSTSTSVSITVKGSAVTNTGATDSAAVTVKLVPGTFQVAGNATGGSRVYMVNTSDPATNNTVVDTLHDSWILTVTSGTVKPDVSKSDIAISPALPANLDYSAAAGTGNTIVVEVAGTASAGVLSTFGTNIVIKNTAVKEWAVAADSPAIPVTIEPGEFLVAGNAADYTIAVAAPDLKTVDSADDEWTIQLTRGTLKTGFNIDDLSFVGLPQGLQATAWAEGGAIKIRVYGTAASPITNNTCVGVIVKGSGVTDPGAVDSSAVPVYIIPALGAPGVTFAFDGPYPNRLIGSDDTMEYSLNGGASYTSVTSSNQQLTDSELKALTSANGIYIRVKGSPPGVPAVIAILPAPAAPAVALNTQTGATTGSATNMEYSVDGGNTWTAFTGNNQILPPGVLASLDASKDFKVRVKAAGQTLPGNIQTINILASSAPDLGTVSYSRTLKKLTGGNLTSGQVILYRTKSSDTPETWNNWSLGTVNSSDELTVADTQAGNADPIEVKLITVFNEAPGTSYTISSSD
ncbi:MAG: S-layer homology domain-containing protein [Clostridiales bacterium]|jgi:hypothetical protein|nr:S-layer homology domain-containing protein [Eubacteriales bacterium]MDH7567012.1 S-layer homology domain-containing protein [Clostridiales bacterium]